MSETTNWQLLRLKNSFVRMSRAVRQKKGEIIIDRLATRLAENLAEIVETRNVPPKEKIT